MPDDLHQSGSVRDHDEDYPEPPQLRRLRRLVSALMIVLMVGIIGIMGAFVWRILQPVEKAIIPLDTARIEIPINYDVLSVSSTHPRMYLLLSRPDNGDRLIEERDPSNGKLIARFRLEQIAVE